MFDFLKGKSKVSISDNILKYLSKTPNLTFNQLYAKICLHEGYISLHVFMQTFKQLQNELAIFISHYKYTYSNNYRSDYKWQVHITHKVR